MKKLTTLLFKTAFELNLLIVLFFLINIIVFNLTTSWMIIIIFTSLLPACSTKIE